MQTRWVRDVKIGTVPSYSSLFSCDRGSGRSSLIDLQSSHTSIGHRASLNDTICIPPMRILSPTVGRSPRPDGYSHGITIHLSLCCCRTRSTTRCPRNRPPPPAGPVALPKAPRAPDGARPVRCNRWASCTSSSLKPSLQRSFGARAPARSPRLRAGATPPPVGAHMDVVTPRAFEKHVQARRPKGRAEADRTEGPGDDQTRSVRGQEQLHVRGP